VTRGALDRLVGLLCRVVLGVFFRRIEVVGRDRLPVAGPRIVVANHVNGLIDPLFVFGPLRVRARMLGKSTLWRIPVLRWLLGLAGAIPIHRRSDAAEGADPARNAEAFALCHEALARGEAISIFPEGVSHDLPYLQPLRSGAARIALGAELERGPLGVVIAPVGLVFSERTAFRSRALVVVGEPIDPAPEVALARASLAEAVRALTARISDALEQVTLNYPTWEEARLIDLGAEIRDRGPEERGRRRRLATEFEARRALAGGLDRLRRAFPMEVASAVEAARDYERLLRTAGLADEQVTAGVGWRRAAAFVARTLARLLVASPVAALGTALNFLPYLAVDAVSRRVEDEPNQIATYKLFPALVLYPLTWTLAGLAAGHWLGAASGVALALVAPAAGWVALRWHERRAVLWRESRAFFLLRNRRRVAEELKARRAAVEAAIERLYERWRGLPPDAEPPPPSAASSRA
jgi:1-acyl-sn-glycerol-3-phosphate acyltransferase